MHHIYCVFSLHLQSSIVCSGLLFVAAMNLWPANLGLRAIVVVWEGVWRRVVDSDIERKREEVEERSCSSRMRLMAFAICEVNVVLCSPRGTIATSSPPLSFEVEIHSASRGVC